MTSHISKVTAALTAAQTPVAKPTAPPTSTVKVSELIKTIGPKLTLTAPAKPATAKPAQPKPSVASTTSSIDSTTTTTLPSAGHVAVSLNNKVVKLEYNKAGSAAQTVELETTNWLVAAIMNLFAKIFPSISYGASEFQINNEKVYVRNSTIFTSLIHGGVARDTFGQDAVANALSLEMHAKTHFSH